MKPIVHTPAADRMQLLDSVRVVAAAGVIVAHITSELYRDNPYWALGSFSVPFYLFTALYFTVRGFRKDTSRPIGGYLVGRVLKLYLPFLVWNVAYVLMSKLKHAGPIELHWHELFWAGFYAHLYFLPLLGVATLVVVLLMRPIQSSAAFRIALSVVMLAGAVLFTWVWTWPPLADEATPSEQALYHMHRTLPPTMLAVIFAIWAGTRQKSLRVPPKLGMLGIALMMIALAYQVQLGPQPIMRALSGFGLVLIAFTPLYFPWLRPVAALGRHSYGVYLSHVAFIRVALTVTGKMGLSISYPLALGVGLFAFAGAALLSIVLAQSKWTSWIVGCDVGAKAKRDPVTPPTLASRPQTVQPQTPVHLENVPR